MNKPEGKVPTPQKWGWVLSGCRKTASAKGFGGKDSVKENRQGFLSRRYHKISELV